MNKKKSVVLVLLLIVVIALSSCLLFACNHTEDPVEEETIEATEGLLIANGDFKVLDDSVDTFPRGATSWSGGKMYSTSSFRDDVIAGVVEMTNDSYAANKSAWDDNGDELLGKLKAGGHFGDSDAIKHALMIYQPETSKDSNGNDQHGPTAYGYTSTSFTLDKGSYYKLSVDVLTYKISGSKNADTGEQLSTSKPGARIYVSSNTYAEFEAIDTNGEWQTYEIYIETSPASTTSLSVQLGLGKYTSSYSYGLTSGYVFFDNLSLKKLTEDKAYQNKTDVAKEYTDNAFDAFVDAMEKELSPQPTDKAKVATTTLKVPNGHFDFGSFNVSSTGAPNSWSLVTGNSGLDDPAPTGLGYNAIIDTATFSENYSKYASNYKVKNSADEDATRYYPADVFGTGTEQGEQNALQAAINSYNRVGTNVFMLSQQLMTAQGIRSSRAITIEKGKTYALKINLFAAYVKGAGVSLILSGSDSKDIAIKGIAKNQSPNTYIGGVHIAGSTGFGTAESFDGYTSTEWTEYTFYIKGNDYKDYSYNLSIWLGTEGTNSNHAVSYRNFTQNANAVTYDANGTFSTGWLFIDELSLTEIEKDDIPDPAVNANVSLPSQENSFTLELAEESDYTALIADLSTDNEEIGGWLSNTNTGESSLPSPQGTTLVTPIGAGAPAGWASHYDYEDSNNPRIAGFISEGTVDIASAENWSIDNLPYPDVPYANMVSTMAYTVNASQDSYYEVETLPINIKANRFYRISFWLKTVDVKSTSGAYVYVLNKSEQNKNIADNKGDDEVVLTSITRVNTDNVDEYLNDWVEINIVVRGALDEDTDIAFKYTLGYGNRWASSTLTSGSMYIANFNMAELTYANYTATTSGTYTKTCDLTSSYSYTFTNGSFDNYDIDDENLDESVNHLYDQKVPATPESWTISDATQEINKYSDTESVSSLYAGTIQLKTSDIEGNDGLYFECSDQAKYATGIMTDDEFFNNFYGDRSDPSYFSEQNLNSIAGPYVLAIGSKDSERYAIGFASSSFTLSANTFNAISVYAKTYGATKATIRLTGEASGSGENDASLFEINSTQEAGTPWTKYVFYIKVGKNSVSLKLNLWLGDDIQYHADEDAEDYEAQKDAMLSAGHVFFDNVTSITLEDEDKFNDAIALDKQNGAQVNELSFETDSFDPLSSSVESRKSLTAPNGWTGTAGTNQSSSDTKAGIIWAGDADFYDQNVVDGTAYVGMLGKEYTEENSDITITTEEILAAKEKDPNHYTGDDDHISELLREEKLEALKINNWIPVSQISGLGAVNGEHMLIINNMKKSAYTYTSATNTLKANSYYQITVYVRTYGLNDQNNDDDFKDVAADKLEETRDEKGVGAYVELYLGSANEAGNPMSFTAIREDSWQAYTFFVATRDDDVTSVTIKLSLGQYISREVDGKTEVTGLTTGYAMFDEVSLKEVDRDAFEKAQKEEKPDDETTTPNSRVMTRTLAATSTGNTTEPETETTTPSRTFNLEYLWWMIPTIILGLVIIAVLIVFVVRKLRKPSNKAAVVKTPSSTPVSTATIDEKHDKYDEDKD